MIVVIDYGRGNLFSIGQALRHLGAEFEVSSDPDRLLAADRVVFPGVGAFGDAMEGLRQRGLVDAIRQVADRGTPLLGICVGCQLLLTAGEEFGRHEGLGLIPGTVRRLPGPRAGDPAAIRIPNVGWRSLDVAPGDPVLGALGPDDMVYFVHSFAPMVDNDENVAARLDVNGAAVPVAVRADNVVGVQFHPEKSGAVGMALIRRFLDWSGN